MEGDLTIDVLVHLGSEDEAEREPFSEGALTIEVTCPPTAQPGDTLEVRVPKRAGGGRVLATIPTGVESGQVFEVEIV